MNQNKKLTHLFTKTISNCLPVVFTPERKKIVYLLLIFSVLLFACKRSQNQHNIVASYGPKVVEARGYVVPEDSLAGPKVIPAGKPTVVRAGKPKVVFTHTNVHPAAVPKIVPAGIPNVCTPGRYGCSLPKIVPAIARPFPAGIPEVVIAKEPRTKDQNPQNFSSFGKLQGLKSSEILSLLQDREGNLWIGTNGSGISRYDGNNFTNFTTKEGLESDWVWDILEDKKGNLWFATGFGGVTEYDGKDFTIFKEKEGLSNNLVQDMYEDRQNNIWFATKGNGVIKYDGKTFTHFTDKEGLSNNSVRCILEEKNGNLWFGTDGGGVSRYDGKSFSTFTEKEGLSSNVILSIMEDKSGNIWFGTSGKGLCKFDRKQFQHFTKKEGLSSNTILSIIEDKSGNIWFGTFGGGVCKYDDKNFTTFFTEKEGIEHNVVWSILEDKNGNLWFATEGEGVNKYDGRSFNHFTEKEGLSNKFVHSFLEDKKGNLWIGTRGSGVSKYDGNSFTTFTEKEGLVHNVVWSILKDKSGDLWFGTQGGVCKYDGKRFTYFTEKEGLINNDVKCILEDKRGHLWFGTAGGLSKFTGKDFIQFSKKEGLSFDNVMSILEDKMGNLWFCGYNGGVTKYDGKRFTHFTEKEGLIHNNVRNMVEDKSGNLWFGTIGGGLIKYNGITFTYFTEKEGLSNNNVRSLLRDKSGNIWIGTSFGLNQLKKARLSQNIKHPASAESKLFFKTYTYEDGFSGIGVNFGDAIFEARDGTIWIGADDRLTAFHPDAETQDTIAPNLQLTALMLFNENIAWKSLEKKKDTNIVLGNGVQMHDFHFDGVSQWYGLPGNLSLPYNNNYLTFQFVGITIQSPKKVKYQYKLEGLDETWSALTNRTEAAYGNLPHGNYTFKIKAMNGEGFWSNEFKYSFTIRPPWWRTWWAYILFAVVITGFIYALFRYRINKIRMQHEIVLQKHKAVDLEMQALRAQMNPHFIFNSLNSINRFILQNNKTQASEYLTKFSRLVRLILQNSQLALIPLESELESLQLYLELEAVRFDHHFEFKIMVDGELDVEVLKVPPLIIQPYAENAIWHGLMHKEENGHLEIEIFQEEEKICCRITDDGIGRKKAAELKSKSTSTHKSMGMHITASRIELLQNEKQIDAHLKITDLVLPDGSAGGTEVLLKIPLKQ